MKEEISYIENILSSVGIFENNVSRAIFRQNGSRLLVEVLNVSGGVTINIVNKTLADIINEISNYSVIRFCCYNISSLLEHMSPLYLMLDENSSTVELGLIDSSNNSVTIMFFIRDAQVEIYSSSGYVYNDLMRTTFSLLLLNTMYINSSLFPGEFLEKAMRLDLNLNFDHVSIYLENDSEMSIHVDLDNMVSTYISTKYGSELRLDLLNLILIKDSEVLDLDGVKLECLFQPSMNTSKIRLTNETTYSNIIEWIEKQIVKRKIVIYDYYSQTELEKPMLTIYLNDTKIISSDYIYTLSGRLRIDVYDKWNVKIFSGIYNRSEINVMIKMGGLIIVNERESSIYVEISSTESRCMVNYTMHPSGLISEMLSVGHTYELVIRNGSSDMILDEEITLPSNTTYRPIIVIILRESEIIQQELTYEQTTTHNVSAADGSQFFESNTKIILPIILIATITIILVGRLVRKYKKRKIVEMEKLIEKIVAEED